MVTGKAAASFSSLEGVPVFISGGGSGIGAALVDAFVAQRARVAFCDIEASLGRQLCERYASDVRPWFAQCDVRDIRAYQAVLESCSKDIGPVRVLVNNAGRDDR